MEGLDESGVPEGMQVVAPHKGLELVAVASPIVSIPSMQWLVDIPHEVHHVLQGVHSTPLGHAYA